MPTLLTIVLLAATLTACTLTNTPSETNPKAGLTNCPEQRPAICTMDYRPVCATRDTGVRCVTTPCPSTEQKTYSNACGACADAKVIGYIAEECPTTPDSQE